MRPSQTTFVYFLTVDAARRGWQRLETLLGYRLEAIQAHPHALDLKRRIVRCRDLLAARNGCVSLLLFERGRAVEDICH